MVSGSQPRQSFQAVDEPEAEAQGRRIRHIPGAGKPRVANRLRAGQVWGRRGEDGFGLGGGRLGYSVHCFGEPAC